MNSRASFQFFSAIFCVLLSTSCASSGQAATPAPSTSPSIEASSKIVFPLTAEDKKKLPIEFKKTLINQDKAMQKQDRIDTRNFMIAQSTKQKTWHDDEKKARKAFFDQHLSGPERRQYVQDYLKRKTEFDRTQKDDLATMKKISKDKLDHFKESMKRREQQFKAQIDQNQRPDASLWQAN